VRELIQRERKKELVIKPNHQHLKNLIHDEFCE